MRIAFAGLATAFHPGTDARLLRARGVTDLVVWSGEPEADAFAAEHGARRVPALDDLVAARPDAAIVTCRPDTVPRVVRRLTGAGVPVFVTKPAVATGPQLRLLDEIAGRRADRPAAPVSTCSVLRFAPDVVRLAARLEGLPVLGVRVTVRHAIGAYLTPGRRWLDDPLRGGGTLATMGLHGVDLASALLGPGLAARSATRAVNVHSETLSEDTGTIGLGWPDGRYGVVEVLGATEEEWYEAAVHTPGETHTVRLSMDGAAETSLEEHFGYAGTLDAFLGGLDAGVPAVPWETSREVLTALLAARSLAART
ncbi:Gfo/Idh/MocA family oxidoreductase [Spirillospora sp. NPDC047279]|uniref:Gfo/Idh/MocA family protein n=1 Tax=Spirillospora sp. NPDC047279 TaxID=3155478 RepID=UPI0033EFCFAA